MDTEECGRGRPHDSRSGDRRYSLVLRYRFIHRGSAKLVEGKSESEFGVGGVVWVGALRGLRGAGIGGTGLGGWAVGGMGGLKRRGGWGSLLGVEAD